MEDNTSAKFEFLASFILPNGILDWFDFIKASEVNAKNDIETYLWDSPSAH